MSEAGGQQSNLLVRPRDLISIDVDALLALNNASVPHVNFLQRDELARILDLSAYARGIFESEKLVGALVALWPGQNYASANYQWFSQHQSEFLYIDRVMIDSSARKSGYGRRLYADIENYALINGAKHLALEVNSEPPNPISMHFHEALHFRSVGELANEDRTKSVVLMMKPLNTSPSPSSPT
ncbi:MAG: GNAT family N-acetyltransferase [Pseudomonadota bacterium]